MRLDYGVDEMRVVSKLIVDDVVESLDPIRYMSALSDLAMMKIKATYR